MPDCTIRRVAVEPLSVPLVEPFVIATATMMTTRAALVIAEVDGGSGLGEAAALPGVTAEDQGDLLAALDAVQLAPLCDASFATPAALRARLEELVPSHVARVGLEMAILDAWGRAASVSVTRLLGGERPLAALHTDITLPIGDAAHLVELARGWRRDGFTVFKVKVGIDADHDLEVLARLCEALPDATLRIDANGGYSERVAVRVVRTLRARQLAVETFEQPCARDDLAGMAAVVREAGSIAVVADESLRDRRDLDRLVAARAATGVNLKLAKTGSLLAAVELGRLARAAGLSIMCGAMVETRLGLVAMAHVVSALGGVDWVDLDTAHLLASDPFDGGWVASGPELRISDGAGLAIRRVDAR